MLPAHLLTGGALPGFPSGDRLHELFRLQVEAIRMRLFRDLTNRVLARMTFPVPRTAKRSGRGRVAWRRLDGVTLEWKIVRRRVLYGQRRAKGK